MKKYKTILNNFIKFFEVIPFIALLAYSWNYISLLTSNPYSGEGKALYKLQANQVITFDVLIFILKQNIISISIFTLIMVGFAWFTALSVTGKKYRQFTISVFEIWITVIFVFVYISRFMQNSSQPMVLAVLITMMLIVTVVNLVFFFMEKQYLKKKLYFFIFIFISFIIKYFSKEIGLTSFTDEFISTLSISFFSILIIVFYLSLRNLVDNVFYFLFAVLIFIVAFPLVFVLAIYAVYTIFFAIIALFSGFHFAGMYDNFFLSHLVTLFNTTLYESYPFNYSGITAAVITIIGVAALILNFEKDKNIKSHKIKLSDIILVATGMFIIYSVFAEAGFSRNKNKIAVSEKTTNSINKNKHFALLGKINFKEEPKTVFINNNSTYVISENNKMYEISTDNLIKDEFSVPKHNLFIKNKDNDTILFEQNNEDEKQLILFFYDVKNRKNYAKKNFDFYSNQLTTRNCFKYKNKNILFLTSYNKFYFIDFKGNILWEDKMPNFSNKKNETMYFNDAKISLQKNMLYVYSVMTGKKLVFDLKNKKINTFLNFYDIYKTTCWDFKPDSAKLIIKYTNPDNKNATFDTTDVFIRYINSKTFYINRKVYYFDKNEKPKIEEMHGYQFVFLYDSINSFVIAKNSARNDNIIHIAKDTVYYDKIINKEEIIDADFQKNKLSIITKKWLLRYSVN